MTPLSLTFDCTDAPAQARFWALALGYVEAPPPQGWGTWEAWLRDHDVPEEEWDDGATLVDPDGAGPRLSFLRVPETKAAKNRIHPDLTVSGGRHVDADLRTALIGTKVIELVAAGATVIEEHTARDALDHVVLLDPEGNEFCVV